MRRLLAVLAAAVLLPLTPASAAGGEVVFVADGPSSTTIDLPSNVALDVESLVITTASPFVHLALHDATGWVPLNLTRFPDGNWMGAGDTIPAGPIKVVVYSDGPATLRWAAPALAGTMTVDVDDPIAVTEVTRTTTPDANGTVESDIEFTVDHHRSLVLTYIDRPAQNHLLESTTFCTNPAGQPCPDESLLPVPLPGGTSRWDIYTNAPAWGPSHNYYKSTTVGDGGPAIHTVVVMPIP